MNPKQARYTEQFKQDKVESAQRVGITQAAQVAGISEHALRAWCRTAGVTPKVMKRGRPAGVSIAPKPAPKKPVLKPKVAEVKIEPVKVIDLNLELMVRIDTLNNQLENTKSELSIIEAAMVLYLKRHLDLQIQGRG